MNADYLILIAVDGGEGGVRSEDIHEALQETFDRVNPDGESVFAGLVVTGPCPVDDDLEKDLMSAARAAFESLTGQPSVTVNLRCEP